MTPEEYAKKLDRILKDLETNNTPFRKAVQSTHVKRITRIFDRGEKVDGSPIGQYSVKPMLVGGKTFFQKGAADKFFKSDPEWRTIKRGGKNYRLAILSGGYREFRTLHHRPVNFINLGLTYDLKFDLSNSTSRKVNMPDKISPHEYQERLKREKNVEKAEGLEDRFGDIFGVQQKERDDFKRIVQVELTNLMSK